MGGGGRMMVDISKAYWNKKEANLEILWQYVLKLDRGAVFKRLGLVAEKIFHAPKDMFDRIKKKCKSGVILLDSGDSNIGPIITRWGTRITIPTEDLL
jgi:predicted transcriptional regulator of viral defense system